MAAPVKSDAWRVVLDTAAKFHTYSLGNVLLMALQAPQATRVAGFRHLEEPWAGRSARASRGIAILAP
jgi:hypothetical protein